METWRTISPGVNISLFNPDSLHRMIPGSVEFLEDESPGKARGLDTREDLKSTTTRNLGVSEEKPVD